MSHRAANGENPVNGTFDIARASGGLELSTYGTVGAEERRRGPARGPDLDSALGDRMMGWRDKWRAQIQGQCGMSGVFA
jgi:hypothetical protein